MDKTSSRLSDAVENILDVYFRPPPGRPCVMVYDNEKIMLASALRLGLARRGYPVRVLRYDASPRSVAGALERLWQESDVALMVLASHRMWQGLDLSERLEERDRLPSLRCRCAPVFFDAVIPPDSFLRLYSADPAATESFLHAVRQDLRPHTPTHVVAPGGTDLRFVARTWDLRGWELMTCPVEPSVTGTIVADAGVFFSRVATPLVLQVVDGRLVDILCSDAADPVYQRYVAWMREAAEENPANWQLAEVGIGGNPNATISDVLMETESVQGTAHVCFGDNTIFAGAGGQIATGWHGGTAVFARPRFGVEVAQREEERD
jgi:hypothetical protein